MNEKNCEFINENAKSDFRFAAFDNKLSEEMKYFAELFRQSGLLTLWDSLEIQILNLKSRLDTRKQLFHRQYTSTFHTHMFILSAMFILLCAISLATHLLGLNSVY